VIDDNRFEKMLALLDVDDSISDSADRRRVVQIDGQGESHIPSVTHDRRVCTREFAKRRSYADEIADSQTSSRHRYAYITHEHLPLLYTLALA
jgi:hypothetical protein